MLCYLFKKFVCDIMRQNWPRLNCTLKYLRNKFSHRNKHAWIFFQTHKKETIELFQIYYALRLSCCIDRLIFQLGVQDFYIKNSFDSYHSSLDERGELLEFLNLRNLGPEELNDLVVLFVDTLKLVMTYSSLIEWNENVQRAWIKLIEILMIELKDRCDWFYRN